MILCSLRKQFLWIKETFLSYTVKENISMDFFNSNKSISLDQREFFWINKTFFISINCFLWSYIKEMFLWIKETFLSYTVKENILMNFFNSIKYISLDQREFFWINKTFFISINCFFLVVYQRNVSLIQSNCFLSVPIVFKFLKLWKINFYLNNINYCIFETFWSLHLNYTQKKDLIESKKMIYGQRYNLFDLRQKFIWFEQIFIWPKDILFESNTFCFIKAKHFFTSNKVFQTNNFFDSIKYFFWVYS